MASQPIPDEGFGRDKLCYWDPINKRDHNNRLLALSQASYIDKMLIKFSMQNSKKGSYLLTMEFIFSKSNV